MKKNKNDKVVIKGNQILSQHTQQILEYLFEKCGMIGKKKQNTDKQEEKQ